VKAYPKDEGGNFLRNIGKFLQDYVVSYPTSNADQGGGGEGN
jgi:hypothetical protein